ncbi:HD-GYP domain-containing protein [Cytobacillus purgationiresistens]|uniref:HD-GYP domain-containing protein (C-di-GMP phosphodiesterase class II) n=1 Tax=Cytobacillus purgationiresistens TaxID=863449 RepID=A0ABU0AL32_9BACI|nr:HD-GYP domain-containing protein [Cytobacillus purgationiresistens]MDQ0271976.1 HD-GYP domain-containing protein (c-di-GMP phosphodiesterase class II) [Cytobacillus purgationiresistens]
MDGVEKMRVAINQLQEGCIVTEDITGMTKMPIISKNTVLNQELLNILNVFLIKEVEVARTLVDGQPFLPPELETEQTKEGDVAEDLIDSFLMGVQKFKREFEIWQAGYPVDISKVLAIMLPLVEKMEESPPSDIFRLYYLSTDDQYIYQHAVAVGMLSAYIGKKLKYGKSDIIQLAIGGCLIDAGMAKVNSAIIKKSGPLTIEEYEQIKKHPLYSFQMVQELPLLKEETKYAIYQHHERLDGSGYPNSKKDKELYPIGRIIAVADAFHAMTSQRMYRRKRSPYQVLEMLIENHFGKYDVAALNALSVGIITFSIGSTVKISNGQAAKILFMDETAPTRPLVEISSTGEILSLKRNRHLYIEEVLNNHI